MYDGTKFKPAGGPTNSASQPTNAVLGDTWFDTANKQLYVYNGTAWTLIGPTTVAGTGQTVFSTDSVEDTTGVNRSILKMIANDALQLSVMITDNYGLDSNYQAMLWFATAERLIEQHRYDSAFVLFDSIQIN